MITWYIEHPWLTTIIAIVALWVIYEIVIGIYKTVVSVKYLKTCEKLYNMPKPECLYGFSTDINEDENE